MEKEIMSFIANYIQKNIKKNPKLAKEYQRESLNIDAAVILRDMRDDLEMSQKEFAKYVGKPQSQELNQAIKESKKRRKMTCKALRSSWQKKNISLQK